MKYGDKKIRVQRLCHAAGNDWVCKVFLDGIPLGILIRKYDRFTFYPFNWHSSEKYVSKYRNKPIFCYLDSLFDASSVD